MCKAPKAPAITQPVAPLSTPTPLALPEPAKRGSVSQLRIGSKSNLKVLESLGAAPSALSISRPTA